MSEIFNEPNTDENSAELEQGSTTAKEAQRTACVSWEQSFIGIEGNSWKTVSGKFAIIATRQPQNNSDRH